MYCICNCCKFQCVFIFFFKHKTADEMRISDWSSDVCSSDLNAEMVRLLLDRDMATPDTEVDPLDVESNDRLNEELRRRLEALVAAEAGQIGRASCRERVCQYV